MTEEFDSASDNVMRRNLQSDREIVHNVPHSAKAKQLASMYSQGKRLQETVCVAVGSVLMALNLVMLLMRLHLANWKIIVFAAVAGIVAADFLSGLLHWGADTWGSVDMPVFGKLFIRSFREHHVDPTAITRHDFIECNGDSFMTIIAKMMHSCFQLLSYSNEQLVQSGLIPWQWFWLLLGFYLSITNQIHKWAHTYFGLPAWVQLLQSCHLILPSRHHRTHHTAPHDCYYTITTGWLNWPLERIGFWRAAESVITSWTGVKPRSDDKKWTQNPSTITAEKLLIT